MYEDNPQVYSQLVMVSENDSSRAMLVKLDNGMIFMDRIYSTCTFLTNKMFEYAQKQNYVYKQHTDAGIDVYSLECVEISTNSFKVVRTGITFDFPDDTAAFIWPKSRAGFLVGAGVVDYTFQGEILVKIFNTSAKNILLIKPHEGIAQIVIVPVLFPSIIEVNEIHKEESDRGATGGIAGNAK